MPRRSAKIDANQHDIIKEFENQACSVRSVAGIGDGFPDLVVWDGKTHHLVEVKQKGGKLTPMQIKFRDMWPGPVHIVRSNLEVLALVQEWRRNETT